MRENERVERDSDPDLSVQSLCRSHSCTKLSLTSDHNYLQIPTIFVSKNFENIEFFVSTTKKKSLIKREKKKNHCFVFFFFFNKRSFYIKDNK